MTRFVVVVILIAISYIAILKYSQGAISLYNVNEQPGLNNDEVKDDIDCPITAGALMSAYTFY